jgi:hypothetical protein
VSDGTTPFKESWSAWFIDLRLDSVNGPKVPDDAQLDRILDAWAQIAAQEGFSLTTETEYHVENYHD